MFVHRRNSEKRTTRLFYELDQREKEKYGFVQEAATHLENCQRVWRIQASSDTTDWKHNAGASTLVRRGSIRVSKANPPRVKINLAVPCIDIGRAKLFFLPDAALYLEHGSFGGISYSDMKIEQSATRFIEDGYVPRDANIIDHTWRYVNKRGGPDRRFTNNAQLPVVQYGVVVLTSSRGLNIHLNTSSVGASIAFANCWREVHRQIGVIEEQRSTFSMSSPATSALVDQAYKMLGVNTNSSADEISAAYRHLAQMYHPDKVVGLAPEFQILAEKRMKEINAAYEALKSQPHSARPEQPT